MREKAVQHLQYTYKWKDDCIGQRPGRSFNCQQLLVGGKMPSRSFDRAQLIHVMPVGGSYCDQSFPAATANRGPWRHQASSISHSVHSRPLCRRSPNRSSLSVTSHCQFLQGSSHGWRTQARPLRRQHRLCQRCCLLDQPLLAQSPCSPQCQHGLQVVAWPSCTC